MPASSARRRSVISPHWPRTSGRRSAVTRLRVSRCRACWPSVTLSIELRSAPKVSARSFSIRAICCVRASPAPRAPAPAWTRPPSRARARLRIREFLLLPHHLARELQEHLAVAAQRVAGDGIESGAQPRAAPGRAPARARAPMSAAERHLGARGRELEFERVGPAAREEPAGAERERRPAGTSDERSRPSVTARPRRRAPCVGVHPVEQLRAVRSTMPVGCQRQRVVVVREVAVRGDHRRHAGGAARLDVALGVADVHAALRAARRSCRAACSSGSGCGLRSGNRVAAHDAARPGGRGPAPRAAGR